MSILDRKLTLFETHEAKVPKAHPTVAASLAAIRSPGTKIVATIAKIRGAEEKAAQKALKSTLPALVWGAEMPDRSTVGVPSGLACLDFDHLESPGKFKSDLATDRHVVAAFFSPTGTGVKVVIPILGDYKGAFSSAKDWFEKAYSVKIDTARSDINGLCYASHDPEIYIAADPDSCEPFKPHVKDGEGRQLYERQDGDIDSRYLSSRTASDPLMVINPNCSYAEWIEIGQAIHCQFQGSGEGLDLWDRWSSHGSTYPGTQELEKHWRSFRGSGRTFRTVIHYARQAGWVPAGEPRARVAPAKVTPAADELGALITAQGDGTYQVAPFPFPLLTDTSYALLPGSVTLLCGAPGSGKSWFNLSCLRYWCEQGIPAAVLMLEETKAWHMNRLLAQLMGDVRILDPKWVQANVEQVRYWHTRHRATIDRVGAQLHCDGDVTVQACAEWVEKQAEAGVRIIVVDPITLAHPGDQKPWDVDRRFMARCKVAIEAHGASLILVTHPRKTQGKITPPTMDDLAGGVAYSRAAACILWLSGYDEPSLTTVRTSDNLILSAVAHKLLRIMKARNTNGQHKNIVYSFRELLFTELGIITKEAPPSEDDGPKRTPRMSAPPSDSESVF